MYSSGNVRYVHTSSISFLHTSYFGPAGSWNIKVATLEALLTLMTSVPLSIMATGTLVVSVTNR